MSTRQTMVHILLCSVIGITGPIAAAQQPAGAQPASQAALTPDAVDKLLAPIALYPDALVLQIVQCAQSPYQVKQVAEWLTKNPSLKGTAAQEAASKEGFDASFIAIVLFPDVVQMMASKPDWTRDLGQAFITDRSAVFASIQRLRAEAQAVGNLKSNDQQKVDTVTTQSGQQVIVVQPANPQVVYVPQYNPQVVYTQPATTTHQATSDSTDAVAAGIIGFAAGVIVGAAADDDDDGYYYACGGWGYRGVAISNDGWNDYYNHRENMANDYYDHRENMTNDYYDHRENMADQRGDNQANRQDYRSDNVSNREDQRSQNQGTREDQRTQNQSTRQDSRSQAQGTRSENQSTRQDSRSQAQGTRSENQSSRQSEFSNRGGTSSRGSFQNSSYASNRTSGTSSGAFSGYQRGSSERQSSSRGSSSMSGRSFSGSRGGGGRRR